MVEWGKEEYVEEIIGKIVLWKRTSLETKNFLVAKLQLGYGGQPCHCLFIAFCI